MGVKREWRTGYHRFGRVPNALYDSHPMTLQFPLGLKRHRADIGSERGDYSELVKGLSNVEDGTVRCAGDGPWRRANAGWWEAIYKLFNGLEGMGRRACHKP